MTPIAITIAAGMVAICGIAWAALRAAEWTGLDEWAFREDEHRAITVTKIHTATDGGGFIRS